MATDDKTLLTRILHKSDSLENWNNSSLVLKQGEIALAYVITTETSVDATTGEESQRYVPNFLMKIGDDANVFKDLKWLSAPASDVYTWAKQPNLLEDDLPEDVRNQLASISAKLDKETFNEFVENEYNATVHTHVEDAVDITQSEKDEWSAFMAEASVTHVKHSDPSITYIIDCGNHLN